MTDLRPCPFCGEFHLVHIATNMAGQYADFVYFCTSSRYYGEIPLDTWQSRPIEDALLDRSLTAEARVAQLEAALEANPQESERLRALIREALDFIGQGHEPGEYAESVWIAGIVNTLKEVDNE